jgi:hypothetical protein
MDGKEKYTEYLLSNKWDSIKEEYKLMYPDYGVCFLCPTISNIQLHHWRYPKDWNNDSYKNLIPLCGCCHKSIHKTKLIHNSHMYGENDLYRYLSHLIKELRLMEWKQIELYANEF